MEKRRNRRKRKQGSRIFSELVKNATREGYAFYFIVNKLVKELTEALYCYGLESLEVAGLRKLAQAYQMEGQDWPAIELYLELLEMEENALGHGHPGLAHRQWDLAVAYYEAGLTAKAIQGLQESIEMNVDQNSSRARSNAPYRIQSGAPSRDLRLTKEIEL